MNKLEIFLNEIQEEIKQVQCDEIRDELILFFERDKNNLSKGPISSSHIAFFFLVIKLEKVTIQEIGWENCVKLHNSGVQGIRKELIKSKETIPSSLKQIIIKSQRDLNIGIHSYQMYINDFYRGLYRHLKHKYTNVKEIECFEKYLISRYSNKGLIYFRNDEFAFALSNYPEDGDYSKLMKVFPDNRSRNYWLNTKSPFIREWVCVYLNSYAVEYVDPIVFRLFGYFFVDSANNYKNEIDNYLSIDDEFLNYQVEYLKNIPRKVIEQACPDKPNEFINQLIILYRSMLETVSNKKEKTGLSSEYVHLLRIRIATKAMNGDYTPIYFNPFETPPKLEKVAILANEYTRTGARARNADVRFLDLSNLPYWVRNDILEYIWNGPGSFLQRIKYDYLLKDFLMFLQSESYHTEQNGIERKDLINHKILYKYRQKMEFKYPNSATLKSVLKLVRSFLKFNKKYGVTDSMMKILNLNNLERSDGGNPISDNDLKIIYEAFKKVDKKDRLSLIVFEIFTFTNLRIGEILNLERDCIEYKDSTGKASIRYISKTSNGEYTSQLMSEKVTFLIEEAIQFTSGLADYESFLSKYIFIEMVQRKISEKLKTVNFTYVFNKILKNVKDKLEYKNYTVNNLRHTYINHVYKEGIKLNYTLPKMAAITNNGYKTAKMYYRKYNEIELYVEALSGVTLTDVDINGEIRKDNKTESQSNVKNNLGQCKENSCVFEAMECLICPHFVTFTNRIPKFENKIKELNDTIKSTSNPIIIDEAVSQKKLLSQYLKNMIALEENKNGTSKT